MKIKKPNRIVILTHDDYWFPIIEQIVKRLKQDIADSSTLKKIMEDPHSRIWRQQRIVNDLNLVGAIFQHIIYGAFEINFEQGD